MDYLNTAELPKELVNWPLREGKTFVRVMTGEEKDSYEFAKYKIMDDELQPDLTNITAKLLVRTLCDENGNRLYADDEVKKVAKISSLILTPARNIAADINCLLPDKQKQSEKN